MSLKINVQKESGSNAVTGSIVVPSGKSITATGTGVITATALTGNIDGSQITTGTIDFARLPPLTGSEIANVPYGNIAATNTQAAINELDDQITAVEQTLTLKVVNAEATAITLGQVVYFFGSSGGYSSVKLASNAAESTSAKTFGVVKDASIAAGGTGYITCQGTITGLNLTGYTAGQTVYLGSTPGSFTATAPVAPAHFVVVGFIQNTSTGDLYVRVENGFELNELHNVLISSPAAGQTLIYDAATSLWKNNTLTAGVGVSIANGNGTITISADGGVNYQGTWNAATNMPTLTSSVGTKGFYYVVNVAGTTNLNGITDWQVGDWALFNGSVWQKVDNTDAVTSVFGRQGAVTAVSTDYSSVGITNTAIGATNPSTGTFTNLTVNGSGYFNGGYAEVQVATAGVDGLFFKNAATAVGSITRANGRLNITASTGASTGITLNTSSTANALLVNDNGSATVAGTLTATGGITGTAIGASSPSTGAFTSLTAATNLSLSSVSGYNFLGFNNAQNLTTATGIYSATGDTNLYLNAPTGSTVRARVNGVDQVTVSGTSTTLAGNLITAGSGSFGNTLTSSTGTNADTAVFTSSDTNANIKIRSTAAGAGANGFQLVAGGTGSVVGAGGFGIYDASATTTRLSISSAGNVNISATTASTSTSTGALVVAGGLGVGGALYSGSHGVTGNLTVSGAVTITNTGANGLVVNNTAGNALAVFNNSAADASAVNNAYFTIQTASTPRWYFGQSVSSLSGDFQIYSATLGATALTINKTTGATTLAGSLTVNTSGGITVASSTTAPVYLNSSAASGKNWLLQSYSDGSFYVTHASTIDALRCYPTTGNVTVGGSLAVSGTALSTIAGSVQVGSALEARGSGYTAGRTGVALGQYSASVAYIQLPVSSSFEFWDSTTATLARLTQSGNLLFGTTTDSGNGKIQLVSSTTSAGGIGFGTDTSLYRAADGHLWINTASGNNPALKLASAGTQYAWFEYYSPDNAAYLNSASGKALAFRTNGGTTALTLGSDQSATFFGSLFFAQNKWNYSSEIAERIFFQGSGASYWKGHGSGVVHEFRNGSDVPLLDITSGGNVLIGTTTNAGSKLSVLGNIAAYVSGGAQLYLGSGEFNNTSYYNSAPGIGSVNSPVYGVAGSLAFYTYGGAINTRTEVGRFVASSNNLLIGTTTDSANGKLQLATHTTSAGGIGFGTDVSLFRVDQFSLGIYNSQTTSLLKFYEGATNTGQVGTSSGNLYLDAIGAKSVIVRTNGSTTALTLDSSQNATFAKNATVSGNTAIGWPANGVAAASLIVGAPAATGGSLWVHTPPGNPVYPCGFAASGTYSEPVATINLTAYGPKASGGYSSKLILNATKDTALVPIVTIDGNDSSATFAGSAKSTSATGGVGYGTGAGGTVTQATSKTTGVTINKVCGQIVTSNSSIANNGDATFTVTNSAVAATDTVIINIQSGYTNARDYSIFVSNNAAGSFQITIVNQSGGALAQALTLNYAIIKSVTS